MISQAFSSIEGPETVIPIYARLLKGFSNHKVKGLSIITKELYNNTYSKPERGIVYFTQMSPALARFTPIQLWLCRSGSRTSNTEVDLFTYDDECM